MQAINDTTSTKQHTATVTQRGQVTIPVAVQRILGIKPREKVAFTIKGEEVRLAPALFTLESAYGSIKWIHKPENFKAIIRSVKEEKARRTMQKLRHV
jgi:AbrB family looped-hinge helix DNA binding protein